MNLDDIKITPLLDNLYLQKISDEEYFSIKYSNYISNSRLGLINPKQEGSIDKFFEGFKPIYSSSLDVGSAVHALTLQPEWFTIVDTVDKPTGKMGAIVEELFKVCQGKEANEKVVKEAATKVDYYKGNVTPTRYDEIVTKYNLYREAKIKYLETNPEKTPIYLDSKSRETSYNCINAINNNKHIQNILHPKGLIEDPISEMEQAILLDVRIDMPDTAPFILKLKAKLDNYVINFEQNEIQVNDIKTLGKILSEFKSNVDKYRYNREIAMYSYLLLLVAEKFYNVKNPIIKGNYLVVSTIPQYYSKVVAMTKKDFIEGFNEFKYLLRLVAYEVATKYKDFAIWI